MVYIYINISKVFPCVLYGTTSIDRETIFVDYYSSVSIISMIYSYPINDLGIKRYAINDLGLKTIKKISLTI